MPPAAISIRLARPDDVPLVLRFIRGLAEYERLLDEFVASESTLREHLFGPRPYCEAILAYEGGEPVGFALFYFTYSTFRARPNLYLEDLFVLPERRGQGAGKALLARLAQIALERDCGRVEWSVLNWNEPAIGFYKRLGARLLDAWTTCRLEGEPLQRLAQEGAER